MPPILQPTAQTSREAAALLSRHLTPAPLVRADGLGALLGVETHVQCEFHNPVRSFKIRGALTLVDHLVGGGKTRCVLTASTGNHGAAMAYACDKLGLPLTVGVPEGCDESKVALIRRFGAQLQYLGSDLDATKEIMLTERLPAGTVFVEDGSNPQIVAGTSTIGAEIARALPEVATVVVPVGNGALIGGLGTALKRHNPAVRLVGVQSAAAPCMALSFAAGAPIDTEACATFASGMAVRVAVPQAVELMLEVVDEMALVGESDIEDAMRHFHHHANYLPEPAGCAPLAAALKLRPTLEGPLCLVATGANIDDGLRRRITHEE